MESLPNTLQNPLNAILLPPILFLLYRILFPAIPEAHTAKSYDGSSYNWAPEAHPKTSVFKKYNVHELTESDGRKSDKILLAIARVRDGEVVVRTVFDVTAGGNFYGPDGMYGNFAGRDASRGMAKQSFDEDMLTPLDAPLDPLTDLTKDEIENMHGWHDHFSGKYIVVGELV